jgi:hypothetical protein
MRTCRAAISMVRTQVDVSFCLSFGRRYGIAVDQREGLPRNGDYTRRESFSPTAISELLERPLLHFSEYS